jgi:hypothetical protein
VQKVFHIIAESDINVIASAKFRVIRPIAGFAGWGDLIYTICVA